MLGQPGLAARNMHDGDDMSGHLSPDMATGADRNAAFSRYLWQVCYQLPIWGSLVGILVTTILVLIFSDYPLVTRLQTALGFAILIAIFGTIFTLMFPPIFRLFYLKVVRRHSHDAPIALPYGFLLGAGLPLLLGGLAALVIVVMRVAGQMIWSVNQAWAWQEDFAFLAFAGLASTILGAIIGPLAAHFGLKALRPRDPFFDPARCQTADVPTGDAT
jgi:hypothetical protein